jgi:hypothetical protein
MTTFFFVMAGICMVAVLAALFAGVASMGTTGAFNRKYGNKLMRARILFQALAIVFLLLAFFARPS